MNISELINRLSDFKTKHGDLRISTEYWCNDCNDTHEGKGVDLLLSTDNTLLLKPIQLGD